MVCQGYNNDMLYKWKAINMKATHLFRSDHGNDGNPLLPHHLPEILTGVGEGTLRGDVVPLLSTSC